MENTLISSIFSEFYLISVRLHHIFDICDVMAPFDYGFVISGRCSFATCMPLFKVTPLPLIAHTEALMCFVEQREW